MIPLLYRIGVPFSTPLRKGPNFSISIVHLYIAYILCLDLTNTSSRV